MSNWVNLDDENMEGVFCPTGFKWFNSMAWIDKEDINKGEWKDVEAVILEACKVLYKTGLLKTPNVFVHTSEFEEEGIKKVNIEITSIIPVDVPYDTL